VRYDENHFRAAVDEIKRHLEDTETSKLGHWAGGATLRACAKARTRSSCHSALDLTRVACIKPDPHCLAG